MSSLQLLPGHSQSRLNTSWLTASQFFWNNSFLRSQSIHERRIARQTTGGTPVEQVVRDYGDVCQAVTNLAIETGAQIEVAEFRTFNRCLDDAIASAVTEHAKHRDLSDRLDTHSSKIPVGALLDELRNYLHAATLVVAAIKVGNVGISGATGPVLDRSLLGMRGLIGTTS
jgi:hypothetical protein